MTFLVWPLALTLTLAVMGEAVVLHKTTVCRQEATRLAFDLRIQSTLSHSSPTHQSFDRRCRLHLKRVSTTIVWRRWPQLKTYSFILPLNGTLWMREE